MTDHWSRDLERLERTCAGRLDDVKERAEDAHTKAAFCERRLDWLTGNDGNNGVIGQLRADICTLRADRELIRAEIDSLKASRFRALGALAAVTMIASVTATVAALVTSLVMRGG